MPGHFQTHFHIHDHIKISFGILSVSFMAQVMINDALGKILSQKLYSAFILLDPLQYLIFGE